MLRENVPDLKIRIINVVDLFKFTPPRSTSTACRIGISPVCSSWTSPSSSKFHGYSWLIHRLTYGRTNHKNLDVRGYKEKGSINTAFALAIRNQITRFSLAIEVIDRAPRLQIAGAHARE